MKFYKFKSCLSIHKIVQEKKNGWKRAVFLQMLNQEYRTRLSLSERGTRSRLVFSFGSVSSIIFFIRSKDEFPSDLNASQKQHFYLWCISANALSAMHDKKVSGNPHADSFSYEQKQTETHKKKCHFDFLKVKHLTDIWPLSYNAKTQFANLVCHFSGLLMVSNHFCSSAVVCQYILFKAFFWHGRVIDLPYMRNSRKKTVWLIPSLNVILRENEFVFTRLSFDRCYAYCFQYIPLISPEPLLSLSDHSIS